MIMESVWLLGHAESTAPVGFTGDRKSNPGTAGAASFGVDVRFPEKLKEIA